MAKERGKNGEHKATSPAPEDNVAAQTHEETPPIAAESAGAPPTDVPVESSADKTARLKGRVVELHRNEEAAAGAYRDAKEASSAAEHELCEHVKALRGGNMKNVEIELDGRSFKPKLSTESGKYRLDRASTHTPIKA